MSSVTEAKKARTEEILGFLASVEEGKMDADDCASILARENLTEFAKARVYRCSKFSDEQIERIVSKQDSLATSEATEVFPGVLLAISPGNLVEIGGTKESAGYVGRQNRQYLSRTGLLKAIAAFPQIVTWVIDNADSLDGYTTGAGKVTKDGKPLKATGNDDTHADDYLMLATNLLKHFGDDWRDFVASRTPDPSKE